MKDNTPVISVIMPCYNREHGLLEILKAYDNQTTHHHFEVIAVDDHSKDNTYALLQAFKPNRFDLRVFQQSKNQGPGAARNIAIAHATAPLMLFVGDDILPNLDFIHWHLQAHQYFRDKNIAILGHTRWPDRLPVNTLMKHIDGLGAQQFSYHYLKSGQSYDYRHFYTSNVSVKSELIWGLKTYFDTDFRYAAFEDAEISWRLKQQADMKIYYLSAPIAQHFHYHNIFTFSKRQYHAGLMGDLLIQKHPQLKESLFPKELVSPKSWRIRLPQQQLKATQLESLEEEILHIANHYEWEEHPKLDSFYKASLAYFFIKGWAVGMHAGNEEKAIGTLTQMAHHFLIPIKNDF